MGKGVGCEMEEIISIIGEMKETSDGPTAVFVAGTLEPSWLNIFGLWIVILMLIPNVLYAIRNKEKGNLCKNKAMNVIEQIGRLASIFLMIFHIGIAELGFGSVNAFLVYLFGNVVLLLTYFVIWILFLKKNTFGKGMALAIIPAFLFLLNGLTMRHWLLVCSAVLFGIGHIYVSYINYKEL